MKTLKMTVLILFLLVSHLMQAQVSVNVNIGSPPPWGPAGYSGVNYYYLPDIEVYYDIRATQFIYFENGRWIRSRYLPRPYRHYDLYNGYKVVLKDYHGSRPYAYFKNHKVKYYKGYKARPQRTIGVRPDNRKDYNNYKNREHKKGKGNGKH